MPHPGRRTAAPTGDTDMIKSLWPLLLAATLLPLSSFAASGGSVEALQMPAWFEHGGVRQALRPGAELVSGDVVSTGAGARVLLRLEEGSQVKLGEDTRIDLETLTPPASSSGLFEALMRISRGAFRFTTTALGKQRRRDVGVRVGVVFAGIRGTDVWGRSNEDGDLLVLIEGSITARREGEADFTMDTPLTAFTVPRGQAALPLETVPAGRLGRLARETELQPGSGVLGIDGRWAVNLASLQNHAAATALKHALEQGGYATELQDAIIAGVAWRRVRISGFLTRQDAQAFSATLGDRYTRAAPWIVKF